MKPTPPPATEKSTQQYRVRMHRVLAYIDQHIDQPLTLVTLAQVAHFSPYHFHRLFAALTGYTLGEYLSRRRLEVAAVRLLSQPKSRVLDIALAVGFTSGEAFSRAFARHFLCSPSRWRKNQSNNTDSNIDQVLVSNSLMLLFQTYSQENAA